MAAADFLKNHRSSDAAAAGFLKVIAVAVDFLKIHCGSVSIFSRTLKKCMYLIEF